ncbi:LysR family transcriptional regulator [Bacteriovorax sp. Seq25_V]|uniref:LysR family transcriptional regulator n=1 Tax=Bacteriovorax sp. Seq25_V TaxID=1201288 RepID=UPI000389EFF2|nr:LysR family transcriptional regulator [Bacteriovorax sp. Seq25_V]EQC48066.1 LysR substrate-binding domain protein [Bacteriovorax sp. Seq25_V]
MIETSQLHTLVAVARAQSFSKAAEELGVTQSAISQSVKNLENKLEVKLFKRSGKKVVLTGEGEKLFTLASNFLSHLDEALVDIQNAKNTMSGTVRIGTLIGVGKSWLAPELLSFAKEYPELSVSISLGFHEELIREFENYRLDFLILPEGALPTVGEKKLLSEETVTLVYPKGNPFGITKDMTIDDLAKIPTVLFEREDQLFQNWCRAKFGKLPKSKNVKYTINSHGNMLQAVREGLGIAVVPNHVLKRSFYKEQVETLGNFFDVDHGKFYLVYHKDATELVRIKKTLERLTSEKNPFL